MGFHLKKKGNHFVQLFPPRLFHSGAPKNILSGDQACVEQNGVSSLSLAQERWPPLVFIQGFFRGRFFYNGSPRACGVKVFFMEQHLYPDIEEREKFFTAPVIHLGHLEQEPTPYIPQNRAFQWLVRKCANWWILEREIDTFSSWKAGKRKMSKFCCCQVSFLTVLEGGIEFVRRAQIHFTTEASDSLGLFLFSLFSAFEITKRGCHRLIFRNFSKLSSHSLPSYFSRRRDYISPPLAFCFFPKRRLSASSTLITSFIFFFLWER